MNKKDQILYPTPGVERFTAKTKINDHKPRRERPKKAWETFEWERIEALEKEIRRLMATEADEKTAIAALNDAVAKVTADVAALKAAPPVVQNVEQADLDANVAAITDATAKLNAL